MPFASRPTSAYACWRERFSAYVRKTRSAIAAETSPEITTASRKRAGSWKRSDRSIAASARLGAHGRVPRGSDLVPDPPDRDDRGGLAELAAELAHVDVDRARVAGERVAPDALEQLVARQDETLVVEQLPEQVELLGRQLHFLAGHARLTSARGALAVD